MFVQIWTVQIHLHIHVCLCTLFVELLILVFSLLMSTCLNAGALHRIITFIQFLCMHYKKMKPEQCALRMRRFGCTWGLVRDAEGET